MLISASDFVIFFLGLEIIGLSLYALCSVETTNYYATEASVKYFVINSASSLFFLFGASVIYYETGSIDFENLNLFLRLSGSESTVLPGYGLLLLALLLKFGVAPFHF